MEMIVAIEFIAYNLPLFFWFASIVSMSTDVVGSFSQNLGGLFDRIFSATKDISDMIIQSNKIHYVIQITVVVALLSSIMGQLSKDRTNRIKSWFVVFHKTAVLMASLHIINIMNHVNGGYLSQNHYTMVINKLITYFFVSQLDLAMYFGSGQTILVNRLYNTALSLLIVLFNVWTKANPYAFVTQVFMSHEIIRTTDWFCKKVFSFRLFKSNYVVTSLIYSMLLFPIWPRIN